MEAAGRAVASRQMADDLACRNTIVRADRRCHRLICGSKGAMSNNDNRFSGDHSGEGDHPGTHSMNGRTWLGRDIDTSVAR
jgi:hypothetical protein